MALALAAVAIVVICSSAAASHQECIGPVDAWLLIPLILTHDFSYLAVGPGGFFASTNGID